MLKDIHSNVISNFKARAVVAWEVAPNQNMVVSD